MSFGLETFKESPLGQRLAAILAAPDTLSEMISLSERGMPALEAVGKRIVSLRLPPTNHEKTLIGRWVREIMEANDWTITGCVRPIAAGHLFSTGMTYQRRSR